MHSLVIITSCSKLQTRSHAFNRAEMFISLSYIFPLQLGCDLSAPGIIDKHITKNALEVEQCNSALPNSSRTHMSTLLHFAALDA